MVEVKSKSDGVLLLALGGRLDSTSAPAAERELAAVLDGAHTVILDLARMEYISSAGLRVLLALQKRMDQTGRMAVRNVPADINEIFQLTGFCDILTVE